MNVITRGYYLKVVLCYRLYRKKIRHVKKIDFFFTFCIVGSVDTGGLIWDMKSIACPITHRIHGAAIYGNMDSINKKPFMLALIYKRTMDPSWVMFIPLFSQKKHIYKTV